MSDTFLDSSSQFISYGIMEWYCCSERDLYPSVRNPVSLSAEILHFTSFHSEWHACHLERRWEIRHFLRWRFFKAKPFRMTYAWREILPPAVVRMTGSSKVAAHLSFRVYARNLNLYTFIRRFFAALSSRPESLCHFDCAREFLPIVIFVLFGKVNCTKQV